MVLGFRIWSWSRSIECHPTNFLAVKSKLTRILVNQNISRTMRALPSGWTNASLQALAAVACFCFPPPRPGPNDVYVGDDLAGVGGEQVRDLVAIEGPRHHHHVALLVVGDSLP
jgi:hypothetical protein